MMLNDKEDDFPITPEGFILALEWAKTQPHPDFNNKTLYDKVYDVRLDGFIIIHEINKFKKALQER